MVPAEGLPQLAVEWLENTQKICHHFLNFHVGKLSKVSICFPNCFPEKSFVDVHHGVGSHE